MRRVVSRILGASTMMTLLLRRTTGLSVKRISRPYVLAIANRSCPSTLPGRSYRLFSTPAETTNTPEPMENVYREWTIEQDQLLWEHRRDKLSELSGLLGRGLGGVDRRLAKLKDVNSPAYERLFSNTKGKTGTEDSSPGEKQGKLVPAVEVLRRIQYDPLLSEKDFVVLYYDRVEDKVMEAPMDLPNSSVVGSETKFVLALPEHRIVAIRYREQIVWDRNRRVDKVFGGSNEGQTILDVVETYEEWKDERDRLQEWTRQRQALVSSEIQLALGQDRFVTLKQASSNLQKDSAGKEIDAGLVSKSQMESYVRAVLQLFRDARQDPMSCPEPSLTPTTDVLALEMFSELVALLPDFSLRPTILEEISQEMNRLSGGNKNNKPKARELPVLEERELEESFVRGSGAGGQKINKTANRVVLLHKPTQLRVECQDTRSLSQNRKIARKRLRYKLDEYFNGSQSRASVEVTRARTKKSKSKARNRARQQRKRLQQKQEGESS